MVKKGFLAFMIVLWAMQAGGQGFQAFVQYVSDLSPELRQAKTDSFMAANPVLPYFDNDTTAVFVYRGNMQSIMVAGDFTGWSPSMAMTSISPTDFYYRSVVFEKDARLDYKFVTDGSWILDPRNPYTCLGGFGPNSELRMPGYLSPPEITYNPAIVHGTVFDTVFSSTALGNSRHVKIYLPPYYSSTSQEYGLILFHDGTDYVNLCAATTILDNLTVGREIVPVVAVFVPPVNREAEYAGTLKDAYCSFINDELMPFVETRYRVSRSPGRRATVGASNGGNIALYLGVNHPDKFGKIAAQSSNVETLISNSVANGPLQNLEFYLDIGTYDIEELIPLVRNFTQILSDKGYPYRDYTWHEGHSWGNWKGHLGIALRQFFPYSTGMNLRLPPDLKLYQNSPNPFREATNIPFLLPAGHRAELTLYDTSGRKQETLFTGIPTRESCSVKFTNPGYPAGTYVYTLKAAGQSVSRTMNIIH